MSSDGGQLKVGMINATGKYLTAETFGFKINVASTTFRKKQLWTIVPDQSDQDTVYIRSHLGRYLTGDAKGNAECSSESPDVDAKFTVVYHTDGSGRWAFCSRKTGYYFGGSDDMVRVYEKQPTETEWWWIHMAIHPQVNLLSAGRKKYVHLAADGSSLQAAELIPWGRDALVELEFKEGRYCVRACDGRYLTSSGRLVDEPSADAMFTFEMRTVGSLSGMALRDSSGKYLTATGVSGMLQAKNRTVSNNELFNVEDSQPQVFFTAHNGKMVSIRQGIDVSANQDTAISEWGDKETFQLESDKGNKWRVRTSDNKYWSLETASGIQAIGNATNPNGLFELEYQPDGAVAMRAANGRYVTAKMNGSLYATSESPTAKELFCMMIVNRPLLVLRCEYGFVGQKSANNARYECNKTTYDVLWVEGQGTVYCLKDANGKYLSVDSDGGIVASQSAPQSFIFELRGHSKMVVKAPNGKYLRGEQNGIITASSVDYSKATLWEY